MTFLRKYPPFPQHIGTGPRAALTTAMGAVIGFLTPLPLHAGDVLRGGAVAGVRRSGTPDSGPNQAVIELARTNARDSLARSNQTIQAVRAMQKAARELAQRGPASLGKNPNQPTLQLSTVTDGLGPGGLRPVSNNPLLWKGAAQPRQSLQRGETHVVVTQNQQQAVLTWDRFNIGKNTTLTFDQSKGGKGVRQWVALNKINDPSGEPSQILGKIQAPGQVYVLNQNGILFGGSAQVNTHTLVASSLPINDNLVSRGLLSNPDAQFLFSALEIPALANNATMPSFKPPAPPNTPGGRLGDVVVEKGAQILSPSGPDKVGGRIALIGPNVRNEGTLATPDGQTVLAAGLQVGFTAHASSDPSLRGLDVYVGSVTGPNQPAYAGKATNSGIIEAPRASVTLAGSHVEQLSVIESTTSVTLNGRIDLLASFNTTSPVVIGVARFAPRATGTVTLGPGSVTTILPEVASDETLASAALPIRSKVNIEGKAIHWGAESQLLAPGADVTVRAGLWLPLNGASAFVPGGGQIYFDSGASINVAGSQDVAAAMTQNIVNLALRGAELADSPTQRAGALRGVPITVDLRKTGNYNGLDWAGTPLGNAKGFLNLVERNVSQLTTGGGTVDLTAGSSVVMRPGSLIDVSGGWTQFAGGFVETTQVLANGRVYDISRATPDLQYTGIYTAKNTISSSRWGISQTFSHPLALSGRHWEESYIQGARAGSLSITAPAMALDGKLRALSVQGPLQRSDAPNAGKLSLAFVAQDPTHPLYLPNAPTPPRVIFQTAQSLPAPDAFALAPNGDPLPLRADRRGTVFLSPELLSREGFGTLKVENPGGDIILPAGNTLDAGIKGGISLAGANILVGGDVVAPSGTISLTAYSIEPGVFQRLKAQTSPPPQTPPPNTGRGLVAVAPGATINAAGSIIDERAGANLRSPLGLAGGVISITGYDVDLAGGSRLDVSGGLRLDSTGQQEPGNAGSISIKAGQDPQIASVLGGRLTLEATLQGFSGNRQAGSLSIQASSIQIGGSASAQNTLLLEPLFFSNGGFGNFNLTGLGSVTAVPGQFVPGLFISPGTVIQPVAQSALAQLDGSRDGGLQLTPFTKPVESRAPVSLAFNAPGVRDTFSGGLVVRGDLMLGEGAIIQTDPNAAVSFRADTVTLLGGVSAPAGQISVVASSNSAAIYSEQAQALSTVYLGPNAALSARGVTLLSPNPFQQRTGNVLPGGSISLQGNIVAREGALLDVSGASDLLEVSPSAIPAKDGGNGAQANLIKAGYGVVAPPLARGLQLRRIDSDAGSITLAGGQSLQSDARLLGNPGGSAALGGTLEISSGAFYSPAGGVTPTVLDVTLAVTQQGPLSRGVKGVGKVLPGFGQFAAEQFVAGGFDSLALKGTVSFVGPVTIQAQRELSVADAGVLFADSTVSLSAPYVKLGTPFLTPLLPEQQLPAFTNGGVAFHFKPTSGAGKLLVRSNLLDIGNLSLQNISQADLAAEGGDIRGNGTLDIAGDITLRAAQIYPPSALAFTIAGSERNIAIAQSTQGSKTVTLSTPLLPPGFGVGSPLLGSTVESISGTNVTLRSGANAGISSKRVVSYAPGSGRVTLVGSGRRDLPLSAGGQLNVYAATITQGGTLVAPLGGITLGWDGSGSAPKGEITGESVSVTQQLTLTAGSLTSVSAINPLDGKSLTIPFGLNLNGVSWIDPRGIDITGGNGPQKTLTLSAGTLNHQVGALLDLRGGGDLFAYRWIKGLGGSRDVLGSDKSFAVLPSYHATYAPYAPFNPAPTGATLGGDPGYTRSQLQVGDSVRLGASQGLPAGVYTLLPARYALLEGGFLVTPQNPALPQNALPVGTLQVSDGSSLVSGYGLNALRSGASKDALYQRFEVAPAATFLARAEYTGSFANAFLREGAQRQGTAIPRVPGDAGHLILQATQSMSLAGNVRAGAGNAFRDGLVDIASTGRIVINNGASVSGALSLNAAHLSGFGAESLLVGGVRTLGPDGTNVAVRTSELTVDAVSIRAPEILLAASQKLTVTEGASIEQSGTIRGDQGADTLLLGKATVAGSGDGLLLRVSSDPSARMLRSGISSSKVPTLRIESGARLSGAGIILDSTAAATLDPQAKIDSASLSLSSGQISVLLSSTGLQTGNAGLSLSGSVLEGLKRANQLSLLSYSSLDFYGTGTFATTGSLALHASQIRGFDQGTGTVEVFAGRLLLDNPTQSAPSVISGTPSGTLRFKASEMRLGTGQLRIDRFAAVEINAANGLIMEGAGALLAVHDLKATTPFVSGAKGATHGITAGGALKLLAPASGAKGPKNPGLGASLTFQGAQLETSSTIAPPSGSLRLTATQGDLDINGALSTAGTSRTFYEITRHTRAGNIFLRSETGSVNLNSNSVVSVAASGPAEAGRLEVAAPLGQFSLRGTLQGRDAADFSLDAGSLTQFDTLQTALVSGGFNGVQSFRTRTGNVLVAGTHRAHSYSLSADTGNITVTGTIDSRGQNGGRIGLFAGNGLTLAPGALLTVAGKNFDAAGKGGSIALETRSLNGGTLDLQAGSRLVLSVAANTDSSAAAGRFTGTLRLRAPQNTAGTDLAISQVAATITDVSSVVAEGFRVFDLTGNGLITQAVQSSVFDNGVAFAGGTTLSRLLAANPDLSSKLVVIPGAEIINTTGNLTLGALNSTSSSDWNLAPFRFGPKNAAGALTLRSKGDLVFYNALSDGFVSSAHTSALLAWNPLLPANAQSWSYRLTAGADLSAADPSRVLALNALPGANGSLLLGKNAGTASANSPGLGAQTGAVIGNRFQVIRTGSGDISVAAGRDVQFLNPFASIYTAGTQVGDPTAGGTFDVPQLIPNPVAASSVLGAPQQTPPYPAQFSLAGGNVSLQAQADIARYTRIGGQWVADSSRELPVNWLHRRGFLDQNTGLFGVAGGPGRGSEKASTAWWIDFSNFFQSVGALGGGNVILAAGRDIANVDAVIPTNARMPKAASDAGALMELGGGNLVVRAGRDLDAGVYYVERGLGVLAAEGSIKTNATRSPSLTNLNGSKPLAPQTWLPTTLFLGKGGFDVSARGDALLGPTANPFLLPGGYNNSVWYKTYFSTYAPDSFVNVSSLAGAVTLRNSVSVSGNAPIPTLQAWFQDVLAVKSSSASFYQPWLRLNESSTASFSAVTALLPGTLRGNAFSGDINVVGALTLSPSTRGTVELAAEGSLNGLQPNGSTLIAGNTLATWGVARINLSDADPARIPAVATPFAYQTLVGTVPGLAFTSGPDFLAPVNALFNESGALRGPDATLTTKQALHAPGPLHKGDSEPVRIFAGRGNISGLTLFSGKAARVIAGGDLTDIAFYVQNVEADDLSVVAAAGNIVASNANTPLRVAASSPGNILNFDAIPLAGDIQVAGPGTLEVFAGRNLDLGIGPINTDGTGVGIVTVGNTRNPALPFNGAGIIAAAGVGASSGLSGGSADFSRFINELLTDTVLTRYLPQLQLDHPLTPAQFTSLPEEQRNRVALDIFYKILRDTGRSVTKGVGTYGPGLAAIDALFGKTKVAGDISMTSRAIKTQNGGNVSLLVPSGKLAVGLEVASGQAIDQGLLTEAGGDISIFADGNVDVQSSRIFTLRGGNLLIWSSNGDIDAGAAAKTVKAAPPTRVIIDPQSADVATDLAGLATGGGIGVLATVQGVPRGNIDLVAVKGTIDAGDAGIRSTGNLNVAAVQVLNAGNIQVSGASTGTPSVPSVAPTNIGAPTAASAATAAASQASNELTRNNQPRPQETEEKPSIVTVEVLGYGGGE